MLELEYDEEAILNIAHAYAKACSTCAKVNVGSVIATEHSNFCITGCNHGCSDCKTNGCRRIKLYGNASKEHRLPSDCDSIHSEVDAICKAAKAGISVNGATIYVTRYPCEACARAIVASGISHVVYGRKEEISEYTKQIFEAGGVSIKKIEWEREDNNE